MPETTDRIEKQILLKAPRSRVWQALSNAEKFGRWFGVSLEGQAFEAGAQVKGQLTYPGYEHLVLEVTVERVEPERLMSFRWHPAAIDPAVDYAQEPTTLVVFELEEVGGDTLLTVVESGFDQLPIARRDEAWRMNDGGWQAQMLNIEKHLGEP